MAQKKCPGKVNIMIKERKIEWLKATPFQNNLGPSGPFYIANMCCFQSEIAMDSGNVQDWLLRGKVLFGEASGLCKNQEDVYKGLCNAGSSVHVKLTKI